MSKPLCKKKNSRKVGWRLSDLVDAKYKCRKCKRVAKNKKKLCKPKRIAQVD